MNHHSIFEQLFLAFIVLTVASEMAVLIRKIHESDESIVEASLARLWKSLSVYLGFTINEGVVPQYNSK